MRQHWGQRGPTLGLGNSQPSLQSQLNKLLYSLTNEHFHYSPCLHVDDELSSFCRAERSEFIQQKYVALAFTPPLTERTSSC